VARRTRAVECARAEQIKGARSVSVQTADGLRRAYGLPQDRAAYLPDPDEPLDRWFQAGNASNADTIVAIARDLDVTHPDIVVDPFVGGGSCAVAARLMGLPFFGIELDPILACATLAKTLCTPHHAAALTQVPDVTDSDGLRRTLKAIRAHCAPRDVLPVSCLAVLRSLRAESGRPLPVADVVDDLRRGTPAAQPPGHVVCGDATGKESWNALGDLRDRHALVYTSPPFGVVSPRVAASTALDTAARGVLRRAGLAMRPGLPATFEAYGDIAMGMLAQASEALGRASVIVEHEPADDGADARDALADDVRARFGDRVRDLRILESQAFSWRGPLSFVVFELDNR
jgi:hypothetical protein